ncbi:MAG: alpha-L-fucosidase [Clostridia bacterium]|nr:alpha-L-fucosidase [Clostridia bacterium]
MSTNSIQTAANVRPTKRQMTWQDTEYYGMIFYGINTFTAREIGTGAEGAKTFFPLELDTDDWAQVIADADMKGMILTAKHYDGFCNWQTKTTDYSVAGSDWEDGKGDLVRLCAESARRHGLKFGLYYPIWDMHEPSFKKTDGSFNDFIIAQLTELLTEYGHIFELYLDDRCNHLINFSIDYARIYALVRKLQPDCAITFRGPDARYLGNARGVTRKAEWSVVPANYSYTEDGSVPASVRRRKEGEMELDIGSAKAIKKETAFAWAPCEVFWPMRSHLFYRNDDEYTVKTKDKILDVYLRTVGANANLCIALAPDRNGKFHETDAKILAATGKDLHITYASNILTDTSVVESIKASTEAGGMYSVKELTSPVGSWRAADGDKRPEITVLFKEEELFDKVVLCENIANGEHIEEFEVSLKQKGKWKKVYEGTNVGHKRIVPLRTGKSEGVRIVIKKYREFVELKSLQIN